MKSAGYYTFQLIVDICWIFPTYLDISYIPTLFPHAKYEKLKSGNVRKKIKAVKKTMPMSGGCTHVRMV